MTNDPRHALTIAMAAFVITTFSDCGGSGGIQRRRRLTKADSGAACRSFSESPKGATA